MYTSQGWFFLATMIGLVTFVIGSIALRSLLIRRKLRHSEVAIMSAEEPFRQRYVLEALRYFRMDGRCMSPDECLAEVMRHLRESSRRHTLAAAINGAVTIPLVLLATGCLWQAERTRVEETAFNARTTTMARLQSAQGELQRLLIQGWYDDCSPLLCDVIVHGKPPTISDARIQQAWEQADAALRGVQRVYPASARTEEDEVVVTRAEACVASACCDYDGTVALLNVGRAPEGELPLQAERHRTRCLLRGDAHYASRVWHAALKDYHAAAIGGHQQLHVQARLVASHLHTMQPQDAAEQCKTILKSQWRIRESVPLSCRICLYGNLGAAKLLLGEPVEAARNLDRAVEEGKRSRVSSGDSFQALPLIVALHNRGSMSTTLGKLSDALTDFETALELCRQQLEGTPRQSEERLQFLQYLGLANRASVLRSMGRFRDALADADAAIAGLERLAESDPSNAEHLQVARILGVKALTLSDLERDQEVLEAFERAESLYAGTASSDLDPRSVTQLASCRVHFGQALAAVGQMDEARGHLEAAATLYEDLERTTPQLRGYVAPRAEAVQVHLADLLGPRDAAKAAQYRDSQR
jgi:tetratricopeptide (TPR) repeat protein